MGKIKKWDRSGLLGAFTIIITILLVVCIRWESSWQRERYLSLYNDALTVGNDLFVREMKESLPLECDVQDVINYLQSNKSKTEGVFTYIRKGDKVVYYKNLDLRPLKNEMDCDEFKKILKQDGYVLQAEQRIENENSKIYVGFIVPSEQVIYSSGIKELELAFTILYFILGGVLVFVIFCIVHYLRVAKQKIKGVTNNNEKLVLLIDDLKQIISENEERIYELTTEKVNLKDSGYEKNLLETVLQKISQEGKGCYPIGGVYISFESKGEEKILSRIRQVGSFLAEHLETGQRVFQIDKDKFLVLGITIQAESFDVFYKKISRLVERYGEDLGCGVVSTSVSVENREDLTVMIDLVGGHSNEV